MEECTNTQDCACVRAMTFSEIVSEDRKSIKRIAQEILYLK